MSALKTTTGKVLILLYVLILAFWIWIQMQGLTGGPINNTYGAIYPIISLIGGLYGIFVVSKKWGGTKSVIGRGIFFLSLGLLAEVFGQEAWSYYTIIQGIEVPYPSIADLGYLAIIPFYSYAMYNFAKASGAKLGLRTFRGRLWAIVIPLAMIAFVYYFFLRSIAIDPTQPLATILNFAYPLLEPIAVSIGILTYGLSRDVLGGIMRPKILWIIFALIFQFITDYTFLYQNAVGTYYNAGIVDLLYTTSFLIMSLGVLSFSLIPEGNSTTSP